jgi:hypothetical protein
VLENESLSVVWSALHPEEEMTVEVVVCVENIVVCVDISIESHTQQPNPSALRTSACYLRASHALNHGHKGQATLGYVERQQDGVLIL